MASKRKSTVPCMIPSKSKHVREEIILGSLPELLPTIPEDSILSISGEESGHFSHSSSKSESGSEMQKGGTYSCSTCRFESRDLNYFLDHMHNCHSDFRAQPTFYCLNCGVSVVRFEALALHNANAHPKIMEGLVTASLTVNKRDGVTTVEQSLFTESGEDYRESGISLTKTPIAKMMKAKGEHKKIVVSHTVEVRKIDTGKDVDPSMLTNVPELQNGALSVSSAPAMPRTSVTHVITKTVSNQVFHQHTPSLYSPPSSSSNKDLPKVMIPLSSIPTYDAAMDTSSFLKTSFGKFPYPTKAELCYLTVVSEFPEEQIKLWFTAQRLKQGISWSPEEIEEARRKMFNTVFQGGAPQKQPTVQRHVNHIVTHHTVHAQPGSKGPNFQMAKVPYGSIKTRPLGVMATQASMSTNPHVTRVSYSTPIVPPKFPPVVRTTQVLTKNTQPTVETNKSNGVSLDMAGNSGFVSSTSSSRSSSSSSSCSSSSSISSYSSSSNGGETVTSKPVHNSSPTNSINSIATCSANISNNDEHRVANTNGKPNLKSNCLPIPSEASNSTESHAIITNTSKSSVTCNNHSSGVISPQEQAHTTKHDDKPNYNIHKSNSISSEYPSTTCNDSVPNLNHASKSPTESTSTTVITKSLSSILDEGKCNKDFPIKGMSILKQLIKATEHLRRYPHSLLVKFLGVHRIKVPHRRKKYFIVMQSVFYPDDRINARYDIKGCEVSRWTEPAPEGGQIIVVLKDLNFEGQHITLERQRPWLLQQVEIDTNFLRQLNVLDYSLLLAHQPLQDDERHQSLSFATLIVRTKKSVNPGSSPFQLGAAAVPGEVPQDDSILLLSEGDGGCLKSPQAGEASSGCTLHSCPEPAEPGSDATELPDFRAQNRRLLPDLKNPLHVIDGPEQRFFIGIIDIFTVYSFKKRLEHLWKRLRHPGRSFSTVSPQKYCVRLCRWVQDHTQ